MKTIFNDLSAEIVQKETKEVLLQKIALAKQIISQNLHLCRHCIQEYPSCKGHSYIFGNGIGKDNIVSCPEFTQANVYELNNKHK